MSELSEKVAALSAALSDLYERDHAAMDLEKLGPDAADAVPDLIRVLQEVDPDEYCLNPFVRAIGAVGPMAKPAAPALMAALEHAHGNWDWSVCLDAAEALGKIGATEAVPLIRKLLEPEDRHYKEALESAKKDERYVRDLLKVHEEVKEAAKDALARLA